MLIYLGILPGDINDDGVISTLDMIMILSHVLNFSQLSQNQFENADLNFDEALDIYYLLLLSKYFTKTKVIQAKIRKIL